MSLLNIISTRYNYVETVFISLFTERTNHKYNYCKSSLDKFALLNTKLIHLKYFSIVRSSCYCKQKSYKYKNIRCIVTTCSILYIFAAYAYVLCSLYIYVSLRSSTLPFMSRNNFYAFNSSNTFSNRNWAQKFARFFIHAIFFFTYMYYFSNFLHDQYYLTISSDNIY